MNEHRYRQCTKKPIKTQKIFAVFAKRYPYCCALLLGLCGAFSSPANAQIIQWSGSTHADDDGIFKLVYAGNSSTKLYQSTNGATPKLIPNPPLRDGIFRVNIAAPNGSNRYSTETRICINVGTPQEPMFECRYETLPGPTVVVSSPVPQVTLTNPISHRSVHPGQTVFMSANASVSVGAIARVTFRANGHDIALDTSSPYQFNWVPTTLGSYVITATAQDNNGDIVTDTSSSKTIAVVANQPPSVSVATSTSTGYPNYPMTLNAYASDADGIVNQVKFYIDGALLQPIDTASPYRIAWTPTAVKNYTLTAVAVDDDGATTTSASTTLSIVDIPPEHTQSAVKAGSLTAARYDIYYHDINGNGLQDIYFRGKVPSAPSFIIYQRSPGYGAAQPVTLSDSDVALLTQATEDTDYYFADFNNDNYQDVLVRGATINDPTLIIAGNAADQLTQILLEYSGANALASHNLSDREVIISIEDGNNDGRDDLVLQQGESYSYVASDSAGKPNTYTVAPPPSIPGDFYVPEHSDDGSFDIRWGESSGIVDNYVLQERKSNHDGTWTGWENVETRRVNSYSTLNKEVGIYQYRVRASNFSATSDYTPPLQIASHDLAGLRPERVVVNADAAGRIDHNVGVTLNGNATINVPIKELPGVNSLTPDIAVNYSSGRQRKRDEDKLPEDTLGYGWQLQGLSEIRRCVKGPVGSVAVTLTNSDGLCLDGEPLILVSGTHLAPGAEYRTYHESYHRVTIEGLLFTPWFKVVDPNGTVREYGRTDDSSLRVKATVRTTPYFQWSVNKATDVFDNVIDYTYHKDELAGVNYPLRIDYAGASIEFGYLLRNDIEMVDFADVELGTLIQLHTVEVKMNGALVRDYRFMSRESAEGWKRLEYLQECGYDESGTTPSCLAPLAFEWSDAATLTDNGYFIGVERFTDSLGALIELDYGFITQGGPNPMLFAEQPFGAPIAPADAEVLSGEPGAKLRPVVLERRRDNALGGFHSESFAYAGDGFESTQNWGFLGFYAQRVIDNTSGIVTYRQQRLDTPLLGRIAATHQYDAVFGAHSEVITQNETVYNHISLAHPSGNTTVYPYANVKTRFIYEQGISLGASQQSTRLLFSGGFVAAHGLTDHIGTQVTANSTAPTVWGQLFTPALGGIFNTANTETAFLNRTDSGAWLIGFAREVIIDQYDGPPGGAGVERNERTVTLSPHASSLLVASSTRYQGDADNEMTFTLGYDNWGNQTSASISGAHVDTRNTAVQGFLHNRYPTTLTNPLSHNTTIQSYDVRFGTPKQATDPNGLTNSIERDPFGRVIRQTNEDGVTTQWDYESCSLVICETVEGIAPSYRVVITSPVSPRRVDYFDSLNRTIRSEVDGFTATDTFARDVFYDQFGRVERYSLPYRKGDTSHTVQRFYDKRHRVIEERRPDGGKTVLEYRAPSAGEGVSVTSSETVMSADGLTTANTRVKKSHFDALGRLINTVDAYATGEAVTSVFDYNAQGLVKAVTVDGGSDGATTTGMVYDAAGNRVELTEPNTGTTLTRYTALGQIRTTTDNKQQTTTLRYDRLGRLTQRINLDGTASWHYDPTGAIGLLDYRTDGNGFTETYRYENRAARLSGIDTAIDVQGFSKHFSRRMDYDNYGRPKTVTSPSGFQIANTYTTRGYLSTITNSATGDTLHSADQVNAFGVTQETYGNGVVTERRFDPHSGRLLSIDSQLGSTAVQQLQYAWRSNATLESRISIHAGVQRQESFTYDPLQRLEQARTFIDQTPQRTLNYAYDKLGNLLGKSSDVTTDRQVTDYTYGGTENAGPHAVSDVTIDGVSYTLHYDNNGAVTHYDAASGADKFIRYNGANQPVAITVGNAIDDPSPVGQDSFAYGPDGNRYYKKSVYLDSNNVQQVEHTFYIGEFQVTELATSRVEKTFIGNTILHIKNTPLIGQMSEAIEYLHRDHLGSVDSITNAGGEVIQPMAFDPYGARRNSDWRGMITSEELDALLDDMGTKTSKGFTGHEHLDRTGFIHMNGRVYDPTLGRFLSPDPIVANPADSQSWNRYSYVNNNPLSFNDPTGFTKKKIVCSDGCYANNGPGPMEYVDIKDRRRDDEDEFDWTDVGALLMASISNPSSGNAHYHRSTGRGILGTNGKKKKLKPGECNKEVGAEECKAFNRDDFGANPDSVATAQAQYRLSQIAATEAAARWLYEKVKLKTGFTAAFGVAVSAESSASLKDFLSGQFDSELGLGIGFGFTIGTVLDVEGLKFDWGTLQFPLSVEIKACTGGAAGAGGCVSATFLGDNYFSLQLKVGAIVGTSFTSQFKYKTKASLEK